MSDPLPPDESPRAAALPGDLGQSPPGPDPETELARGNAPGLDRHGRVRRTRTSGIWVGLILSAIFLILLIVFIAQNSHQASVHFFGWDGNFPLGLTILFAAIAGMLLVAIPGTVRILQLRRNLRKNAPHPTIQ
ncbi:putative integral membrane protein [Antricoccus suffuscus]|uniref:Putative integral membrane protein n=1 Tax=Antricoccus suffuscus TaxID=1629062 RepID=A0A2T1A645_9ACTN|nr:lipopolysaccharide assembly protein LapA domain-containing protein [Antricoccus suffuscus]PRZ44085.1 putative integral membrane protein [Antricoccus suffuscus]